MSGIFLLFLEFELRFILVAISRSMVDESARGPKQITMPRMGFARLSYLAPSRLNARKMAKVFRGSSA